MLPQAETRGKPPGHSLITRGARSCSDGHLARCNFRVHGGRMRIRKLGVVGAGTMGAGISALAASAGIPVVLLDIAGKDADRNAPARAGVERMKKSKPAAF